MTGGGQVVPHLVIGQVATNSPINAGNRTQCSRRCSASGGSGWHIPGRSRKALALFVEGGYPLGAAA